MSNHVMQLVKSYPDGTGEWLCPVCGRMILLCFSPYKKEVIVSGDDFSVHSGGIGGLSITNTTLQEHDQYLDVFNDFMNNI